MENRHFSIGVDFGTNMVRALIVDLDTGEAVASESAAYRSGEKGVLLSAKDPFLARQYPGDYLESMETAVKKAVAKYHSKGFRTADIRGIGVDTTGSTPVPVDEQLRPVAFQEKFKNNLNAQAWLWKDHTAAAEAEQITWIAAKLRPEYLKKCGGAYSSEWFFSKIWRCFNIDREVFNAAYTWLELSDYIPAVLAGINDNSLLKRNACAAGHKAMYNDDWNGLPDEEFLGNLAPEMAGLKKRLYDKAYASDTIAGYLCAEWAGKVNLSAGIPIAVGALDAHCGAVGSGVGKGVLVKIIGTSTCDIMVSPLEQELKDIPGVAGIARNSVLPGFYGVEAGQSAVGDIFNWYIVKVLNKKDDYHKVLSEKASKLKAGQSGLLALDWNNGNRNILTDPNLTGLLVGQTLVTRDYEIYRALIEATAFGARRIIEQMENYGIEIGAVINCGGIAEKNPLVMQIYADVLQKPMLLAASSQTCALGAAIMGGLAGLKGRKGFENAEAIQQRVCQIKDIKYEPNPEAMPVYQQLYELYKKLHDSFGMQGSGGNLFDVMKQLLKIRRSTIT